MNKGYINKKNEYIKHVHTNEAVIWMYRELSLPPEVMKKLEKNQVKIIRFIDDSKHEIWTFSTQEVFESMTFRKIGQEPQYYFPIELRTVTPLMNPEEYVNPDDEVYIPLDAKLKLAQLWKEVLAKKKQSQVNNFQLSHA